MQKYDPNNLFAKILRQEIPCRKVYENDFAFAFHDINPKTPFHILIIPKGPYCSFDDFAQKASDQEVVGFVRAVQIIAEREGFEKEGYRILSNIGANGGQEVPHFHIHLFAGKKLGPMINPG